MTTDEGEKDSQDTRDAIEVEQRFAEILAAQMRAMKNVCLVRDASGNDSTRSVSISIPNVWFRVRAVTSLDPHTPNVAAVAVNIHAQGKTMSDGTSSAAIPVLIEKERDFDIGARFVIYEWDRMAKPLFAETKNKNH